MLIEKLTIIPTTVSIYFFKCEYITIFVLFLLTKVLKPKPQKSTCVPAASFHHVRQQ